MKIKMLGLCRGDGKLYVKIKTSKPVEVRSFSVKLKDKGRLFPIHCYPYNESAACLPAAQALPQHSAPAFQPLPAPTTEGTEGDCVTCAVWVLVLPILNVPSVEVECIYNDKTVGVLPIKYVFAKWVSRFNYRVKKKLCASIRDYEEAFTKGQYQIKILRFLEGDEGIIWRTMVSWQGDSDKNPVICAFDGVGEPLTSKQYFFEFQPASSSEDDNKLFYSVELPTNQKYFFLVAGESEEQCAAFASSKQCGKCGNQGAAAFSSQAKGVQQTDCCNQQPFGNQTQGNRAYKSGFCSIREESYEGFKYGSWRYMKDARADDRAYQAWFKKHQVQKKELSNQKKTVFEIAPRISIVVPCFCSNKLFLLQMIKSVMSQSYQNWELLLLDASPESGVVEHAAKTFRDSRIRYINLGKNEGIVKNTNEGIKAAKGEFVAFLDHDDLLEPDALYCYVAALNKKPSTKVFFCDEDLFEKPGAYIQPVFKTNLNLDLLYSHNCVTHFLMIERDYLLNIGLSEEEVSGAQDYDITLRAYEGGGEFCHIPRVLYHWRMHSGSTSGDSLGGKPYAQEAGKIALQKHFDRRGIAANVTATDHLFVYRVNYALPEPNPLVSIIIPSKDHIDVLDACITSILNKVTYTNYEIVVIENNSVDPQTFTYYERLQFKHGQVHVVTWPEEFNYSKIINFGVQHAKGKYLLLLNNDTEVITPNFIEEMMGYLQRPEVGVVGAKLYFRDRLTQHAGMLVGVHGAVAHVNQDFPKQREGYLARAVRPGNFSGVTGACQMVRREAFEEVGGYTESLAVGFNDIDFCLKLIQAGYRVVFTPYAKLYHYEFVSRGREVASSEKLKRWEQEKASFTARWQKVFDEGDPFSNPNLDKNSPYYALSED